MATLIDAGLKYKKVEKLLDQVSDEQMGDQAANFLLTNYDTIVKSNEAKAIKNALVTNQIVIVNAGLKYDGVDGLLIKVFNVPEKKLNEQLLKLNTQFICNLCGDMGGKNWFT